LNFKKSSPTPAAGRRLTKRRRSPAPTTPRRPAHSRRNSESSLPPSSSPPPFSDEADADLSDENPIQTLDDDDDEGEDLFAEEILEEYEYTSKIAIGNAHSYIEITIPTIHLIPTIRQISTTMKISTSSMQQVVVLSNVNSTNVIVPKGLAVELAGGGERSCLTSWEVKVQIQRTSIRMLAC
jgi:hypothetical protein